MDSKLPPVKHPTPRARSPTSSGACSSMSVPSGSDTPLSALVHQAHEQQIGDGGAVRPRPSPTQPFGEYVATSMFLGDRSPIGLVAACCATLYLTRENPKLLETLVDVFAALFPHHKQNIMTRFHGLAERKKVRIESTKARTLHAAMLSPGSSSTLDEVAATSCHQEAPMTLTTAPSSPAVVVAPASVATSSCSTLHHNNYHDDDKSAASLRDDERASTKSPDGDDTVHLSMGPRKRTLLPRDPSVSTTTTSTTAGGGSNDPPSVNRTTSYQLVEDGVHTTSFQLAEDGLSQPHPDFHRDPHGCPPALIHEIEAFKEKRPVLVEQPPQSRSVHIADSPESSTSANVPTFAPMRLVSSPACSNHSEPPSPNASSHSTIQPLFREHTSDLIARPEMVTNFFFTMVQGLVNLYFSYNWDVVDDVLQINQEYLRYVEDKLIPRVLTWVKTKTKHPELAARGFEEYEKKKRSNVQPASTTSATVATSQEHQPGDPTPTADHPATAEWLGFTGGGSSDSVGEFDPRAGSLLLWQRSSSSSTLLQGRDSLGDVLAGNDVDQTSVTPPLHEDMMLSSSDSGGIVDASTVPFPVVTSDNVTEFLYLARDAPLRPLVLFFHVPFSQPSCTMWGVLNTIQQQCAQSPTAPIIGLVYGVAEVELADTFNVTWYPTLILIPSGKECYEHVVALIDRCTAATHLSQLQTVVADAATTCQGAHEAFLAASQDALEDIPKHSPRSFGEQQHLTLASPQFDAHDEAELEAAHNTLGVPEGARSITPPSLSTSRCEKMDEAMREISLLEAIVASGPRAATPSRSRSPARDISNALSQENQGEGVIFFRFPEKGLVMAEPVMEWIKGEGAVEAKQRKVKAWITRLVALTAQMKFKPMRQLHSAVVMLQRLQGNGTKVKGNHLVIKDDGQIEFEASAKAHTSAEDPPFFIFLGGGMAAGKTTAATALTRSEWWEAHKDQVVVVDADTFKMADPIRKAKPSDLHEQSTKYAEKLLVTALNQGRSVIFDGTMMWAPFVEQTAAMVREAHTHYFSMGPGFDEKLNIEQYWERGNARSVPLVVPYHILFLAITVEPHEAVPRGILRGVTTGRTVPIRSQLRSFRLFSKGFERYAKLCDEVTLYNNNIRVDLEQGQLPPRILHKDSKDQEMIIEDEVAYHNFLRHRMINDRATCCDEIYHPAATATTLPAEGLVDFGRRASLSASFGTPPKVRQVSASGTTTA
jgi:hypothetical protein